MWAPALGADAGNTAHRPSASRRRHRRPPPRRLAGADDTHPSLVGATAQTALDHFAVSRAPAPPSAMCMVAGRWVIRDGGNAAEESLRGRFAGLMNGLAAVDDSTSPARTGRRGWMTRFADSMGRHPRLMPPDDSH